MDIMCKAPTKKNGEDTETSVMIFIITMCDVIYADGTIIVKYIQDIIHEYLYLLALLKHYSHLITIQIQNCNTIYRCCQNEFGFCRYTNIKISKKSQEDEQLVPRKSKTSSI